MSVNNNPKYTKFIPLVIFMWEKFYPSVKITIIYIDEKIPDELLPYEDYITLFKPIENIHTAFIAQMVRMLYAGLFSPEEVVMITDIDSIPANSDYFNYTPKNVNAHISFRPENAVSTNQISIMFNANKSKNWSAIFGIKSINDINKFLINNMKKTYDGEHGGNSWFSDQEYLYTYVMEWKYMGNEVIFLNDSETKYKRLDWYSYNYDRNKFVDCMKTNVFSDAHIYAHSCCWNYNDINYIISLS